MRLTDISLNWVLPSAVLLVGALTAVLVMARSRRHGKADDSATTGRPGEHGTAPADSSERLEKRRRRKETLYATAAYLLLFCCAAVAAALSFHGLVGFGRQNLGLSGGWEYLVPFGLDGAAMFSAMIAVREASHGDASLGSRLLVWIFAGAAAWFNWVHAPRGTGHDGAPQFFAGMSLSAAILFDRALKQTRRAALREQGLVPRPLPQIRVVRWLRAPRETFGAWSLMLLEGVRTLDEAVDEVREDRRRDDQERLRRREQERLERARVKALNRQHRLWSRGRGAPTHHVDREIPGPAAVSGGSAISGSPAASGGPLPSGGSGASSVPVASATAQHAVMAEPADISGTSKLPVAEVIDSPATRGRPALQAVSDETSIGAAGTAGIAQEKRGRDERGAASPRLDSLEEKLAEIERQFG